MQTMFQEVRANPQRVVFAEGEEEKTIRAAVAFRNAGYGTPMLLGRDEQILATMKAAGLGGAIEGIEIVNARLSERTKIYTDMLYARLQRKGLLYRDAQRQMNQERNVFAAAMVAAGDADAMVTGLTRNYYQAFDEVRRVVDPKPGELVFGTTMLVSHGRTVFISDSVVHETPTSEQLADIACQTARQGPPAGL